MPDTKITALAAITTVDPAADVLPIVDISDTSMAASGTTKKITSNQILGAGGTATLASATITGAATVGTTLGVTGVSTFAAGTALLPALTTTGDTNTGIYYPAADTFAVTTGGSERLRIDASGNCGIGVTPSAWVSTFKAINVSSYAAFGGNSDDKLTLVGNNYYNDGTAKFIGNGYAGAYSIYQGAHRFQISTTNNSSGAGAALTFTQAMTLDASGTLLVGTTSSLQNTSHSFKALGTSNSFWASTFQHDGTTGSPRLLGWRLPNSSDSNAYFVYAINSGGNCFNVFGNGSVTNSTGTYGTISDLRLKENISDARNYLADLLKLRVVKYSLKSEQSSEATKLGFIAQEVEQVFPTLVETNADDVKSIKTTVLIPMLLKALQELTARVQTLETR